MLFEKFIAYASDAYMYWLIWLGIIRFYTWAHSYSTCRLIETSFSPSPSLCILLFLFLSWLNFYFYLYFIYRMYFFFSCSILILNDGDLIKIYFSLVASFLFPVKFDCFTDSLSLFSKKSKRRWWKKYKLLASTDIPVLCSYHMYIFLIACWWRRRRLYIWREKTENKFLSQLFEDFLFIRPYTSLCLYIL